MELKALFTDVPYKGLFILISFRTSYWALYTQVDLALASCVPVSSRNIVPFHFYDLASLKTVLYMLRPTATGLCQGRDQGFRRFSIYRTSVI